MNDPRASTGLRGGAFWGFGSTVLVKRLSKEELPKIRGTSFWVRFVRILLYGLVGGFRVVRGTRHHQPKAQTEGLGAFGTSSTCTPYSRLSGSGFGVGL